MNTKETGNKGESLACEYLVKKGFKILERNCVLFCGEIDIIAKKKGFFKKDKTIHFIEVKTSTGLNNKNFFPEQRVDWKKQNKYKMLAETWLEKNKMPENTSCQIDVIAILLGIEDSEIKFFENIISI